jgi:hypothetical protein
VARAKVSAADGLTADEAIAWGLERAYEVSIRAAEGGYHPNVIKEIGACSFASTATSRLIAGPWQRVAFGPPAVVRAGVRVGGAKSGETRALSDLDSQRPGS